MSKAESPHLVRAIPSAIEYGGAKRPSLPEGQGGGNQVIELHGFEELATANVVASRVLGTENPISQKLAGIAREFDNPATPQEAQLTTEESALLLRTLRKCIDRGRKDQLASNMAKNLLENITMRPEEYRLQKAARDKADFLSRKPASRTSARPSVRGKTSISSGKDGFRIHFGNFGDVATAISAVAMSGGQNHRLLAPPDERTGASPTLVELLEASDIHGNIEESHTYEGEEAEIIIGALARAAHMHAAREKRLKEIGETKDSLQKAVGESVGVKKKIAEIRLKREAPRLAELVATERQLKNEANSAAGVKQAAAARIVRKPKPNRSTSTELTGKDSSKAA